MRLEGGTGLFVNVCSHSRIRPPSGQQDGTVSIALGFPRKAEHPKPPRKTAFAVDVVVHADVSGRAVRDASFREEVASLAAECAREVLKERRLLPHMILQGYRVLPPSETTYVGELQPFADVTGAGNGRQATPDSPLAAASAATSEGTADVPASLLQQLASLGGGRAGGNAAAGRGGVGGDATASAESSSSALGSSQLRLPGGFIAGGEPSQPDDPLPGSGLASDRPASGASLAGSRKPLVEEVGSHEAVEEEPEHTLEECGGGELRLLVRLPRVAAVSELDVEIGDRVVLLRAEGLYRLELALPHGVDGETAQCKFAKKQRTLTVTMPIKSVVGTS